MTVLATEAPARSELDRKRYEPVRTAKPEREYERCPNEDLSGRSCKRRNCKVCGTRWAKRWSQVFLHNLLHRKGRTAMITITAPGVEGGLAWDRARCLVPGPHRCSGPLGCVVEDEAADVWSYDAPERWRRLRQAARVAAQRATRSPEHPKGLAPLLLGRVWEPQKRGVPHLHVVVACETPDEIAAAEAFRAALARMAISYSFGFVDRGLAPGPPQKAASYVADYLTGRQRRAREKKATIRANVSNPRMPRSLLWLTPALTSLSDSPRIETMRAKIGVTKGTGVTMRTLRYVGWYKAALAGRIEFYPRIFGERLAAVLSALWVVESQQRRGPPQDEATFRMTHYRNLRLMRQLQPAYDWRD